MCKSVSFLLILTAVTLRHESSSVGFLNSVIQNLDGSTGILESASYLQWNTSAGANATIEYLSNDVPVETLISRMNLANVHMGCHIASWVYVGVISKYKRLNDCRDALDCAYGKKRENGRSGFQQRSLKTDEIQPFDTVYVEILQLEHFYNHTLPEIKVDFVLISGQTIKIDPPHEFVVQGILDHPRVQLWFLQNLSVHAPHQKKHAKLRPWPYGIHYLDHPALLPPMIEDYTTATQRPKQRFIYVGYLSKRNNMSRRRGVPSSDERVSQTDFYKLLHESKYIVSPDGDRPECYRHYEAVALGAVPITQMDPLLHRHLVDGPVIFNQHNNWNLTKLQSTLPSDPAVNRRLVFAEYWMAYVEREIQREVRWWDPVQQNFSTLTEIATAIAKGVNVRKDRAKLVNLQIPRMIFCDAGVSTPNNEHKSASIFSSKLFHRLKRS